MALEFDGVDDWIQFALTGNVVRPTTMCCWMYYDGSGAGTIMEVYQAIGTKTMGLRTNGSSKVEAYFGASGVIVATDPSALSAGWHHLIAWYDDTAGAGNDTVLLAVDGAGVASNTGTEVSTGTMARLRLANNGTGTGLWNGKIAEACIWAGDTVSDAYVAFPALYAGVPVHEVQMRGIMDFWARLYRDENKDLVKRAAPTVNGAPTIVDHPRQLGRYRRVA